MTNFFKKLLTHKYILLIILVGGILRFINLGYSDFQGDEIKALFLPEQGQSTKEFLLEQRKGPLQFLVTYLTRVADPLYQDQFLNRLPFAIAGTLSIVLFYLLIKELFNEEVAFYSSFFFATNGFLIAFSRIVQYQSLVIMFMLSTLYFLKKKNIYLGLITWALSILAHYDGIFIFPLAFYFLYEYLFEIGDTNKLKDKINFKNINKNHLKHFLIAGVISLILLLSFYIPFVVSVLKDTSTQDYWIGRITGEVSSKISSSNYLFTVYQPIYVIHIYYILTIFSLLILGVKLFLARVKTPNKVTSYLKTLSVTPLNKGILIASISWMFLSFVFMEIFVSIPGTHIYTYLIPCMIFMGLGISFGKNIIQTIIKGFNNRKETKNIKATEILTNTVIAIVFIFIFSQVYTIFVDNTKEYPWEEEKFLLWTLPKPTPIFHLSMFGFPYYRDWEGIQEFILESTPQPAYSTNERESIARHYISLPKDTDEAGFYVYIKNPQTFTNDISNKKVEYWSSKYSPNYVFQKEGRDLVQIFIMEPGSISTIQTKGF